MNISLIILNIIVFIIIILFGLIIARVLSNLSKKIIDEFEIGRITSNKFTDYAPEIIKYKINDIIKVKNISGRIIKKDLTEIQIENEHETGHVPYLMLK